jgi:hypothetical protein
MGLDMYLSATKYVGDWDHNNAEERAKYRAVLAPLGLEGVRCDGSPSCTVSVNVAYWRKANQIHAWFVANVQEGKDDCQDCDVSREELAELVALCKVVLADHERTDELPPAEGFFFGSTEIDQYYFDDLESTVKQLESVLANKQLEGMNFFYRSSW